MFNSRDKTYRNPIGAVPLEKPVHFKINPSKELACTAAFLIVSDDKNNTKLYSMFWCGEGDSNTEWWECHFAPDKEGVYFYSFELKTNRGRRHLYKGVGGKAKIDSYENKWQLTVYQKDLKTPSWLAGGIMYQIFPDRFCFSGEEKSNVPKDRKLRDDWGNIPDWVANEEGEITNSDYFKGDFKGIEEKLDYIKSLGVNCIYLNPVFEAHSNHRYNTANYMLVDPLLGSEQDYKSLCARAKSMGINIILDGVFSHTGSDSVYFNLEKRYDSVGAYNSKNSPYFPWYDFKNWPEEYDSWWGFYTLPNVKEDNPEYTKFICGDEGVIKNWIKKGSKGWRLDVVDELPDAILENIYKAVKEEDPESIVIGEVWEDASSKFAYGQRRKYLLGSQMDSVMNYPFAVAIINYVSGGCARSSMEDIETIVENYPPHILRLLMNHIGTHDTERIITVLGGEPLNGRDRYWQVIQKLSNKQKEKAIKKLKIASLLQYFLPGVPSIYYADEAGLEGYKDPFNRGCYPWGGEEQKLITWYKTLGKLRNSLSILKESSMRNVYSLGEILCFERYETLEDGTENILFIAVNRSNAPVSVPVKLKNYQLLLGTAYGKNYKLPPYGYSVIMTNTPAKF